MGCKIIIEDTNKLMDSKMNICIQGLKKFQEIKIILETNCFYNINAPMNWSENTVWQWEFPGFSVDKCFEQLLKMQKIIENQGKIEGTIHRYLIAARK